MKTHKSYKTHKAHKIHKKKCCEFLIFILNAMTSLPFLLSGTMAMILCPLHIVHAVGRGVPPRLSAQDFSLKTDFHFYTTDSNYSRQGGGYEKIGKGRNYTHFLTNIESRYGLSHRMNIIGSAGGAYAQSTTQEADRSHLGLTEIMGGGQIQLVRQAFSFITESFIIFPLNAVDDDSDEVLTGEGAMVIQVGGWFSKEFLSHTLYLYLAYAYRDDGRASLLPWSLGVSKQSPPWSYRFEFGGFNIAEDDIYIQNSTRREGLLRRVNGGSFKYNSINPQVLEFTGEVGYYISPEISVSLGLSSTLNGQNYGAGPTLMVGFQWSPRGHLSGSQEVHKKYRGEGEKELIQEINELHTEERQKESKEGFEIPVEEYDPSLFE